MPDIRIPDYSLIARHLQDAGHKANFEVLVSSTDNEREQRPDQSVTAHLKAGVGGLVLVAPHQGRLSLSTLVELEKSGVPVVNYARRVDVVSWPTVQTDTTQAVYLPVKHLCEVGRRRIGYLSYPSDTHGAEMMFGLYRAVAEAGLNAENISKLEIPDTTYLTSWSGVVPSLEQILEKSGSTRIRQTQFVAYTVAYCCHFARLAGKARRARARGYCGHESWEYAGVFRDWRRRTNDG